MDRKIKQGIDNCYVIHMFEIHPGYEKGLCSGLYEGNGNGDLCDPCKKCALFYENEQI